MFPAAQRLRSAAPGQACSAQASLKPGGLRIVFPRQHWERSMKLESVDRAVTVQSSNVDLGDALRTHAEENILRVAGKYFGRLNVGAVHFNKEGINYRCTVNMQMGALPMMSGEAQNKDIYQAFNAALDKVAKQLRRTKRELRE